MTTAFNTIVKAFEAKLKESPAVCANVFVSRDRQVPETVQEAVHIEFSSAVPRTGVILNAPIDWVSKITVDCMAKSKTQSGPDAVDALFKKVFERLATDQSLGVAGLYIGFPIIESDFETHGQKAGQIRLTYEIEHRTNNLTLD